MKEETVADNRKIAVLIVDDDRTLCAMLEDMLSKEAELEVASVHDGLEAVDKMQQRRFDLILTDLMMPGVDGIEVLKAAKEIDESVHVIIVTGFASIETAMEAIKKGAYDYITKPFRLEEIKVAVENACEKIRLLRQNRALAENLKEAYEDIEALQEYGKKTNARADSEGGDLPQNMLAAGGPSLQTLPSNLPPSYYLRRRRGDKGYVLVGLEKLGKLRACGVLTEEEFHACKKKFLRGL